MRVLAYASVQERQIDRIWFNVPLDTPYVIFETILPANQLTGAKPQSSQPNTWLILVNKIRQQPTEITQIT